MIRLLHPDGTPVYLSPRWVLAIQLAQHDVLREGGMQTPLSAVHWIMPTVREDRTHSGYVAIVRGGPDDVARALGLVPPEPPGNAAAPT